MPKKSGHHDIDKRNDLSRRFYWDSMNFLLINFINSARVLLLRTKYFGFWNRLLFMKKKSFLFDVRMTQVPEVDALISFNLVCSWNKRHRNRLQSILIAIQERKYMKNRAWLFAYVPGSDSMPRGMSHKGGRFDYLVFSRYMRMVWNIGLSDGYQMGWGRTCQIHTHEKGWRRFLEMHIVHHSANKLQWMLVWHMRNPIQKFHIVIVIIIIKKTRNNRQPLRLGPSSGYHLIN